MVVAEAWSEQRVLMRAYANSTDQTLPTITLHGQALAIGPAGLEPHGPWGIHVEPPAQGRAQVLRHELQLAARRLAGSKGNPPRLMDEESSFDRKATNFWAPGTPPDLPPRSGKTMPAYYEPGYEPGHQPGRGASQGPTAAAPRRAGTTIGYAPAHGRPSRPARRTLTGAQISHGYVPRPVASLVKRTIPNGFRLERREYLVLDALGDKPYLTAADIADIADIADVGDGAEWMRTLIDKLTDVGIDVIAQMIDASGRTVYALRH